MIIEHEYGWIGTKIDPKLEIYAQDLRRERDKMYGNIYLEHETDKRWVGDLGEFVFYSFLKNYSNLDFDWLTENAAGKPDFIVNNVTRVGVKTVKRRVEPVPYYTAQITAKHTTEPVEHYFFLTYQFNEKIMWLLGGIKRESFLENAVYYGSGDWVHSNYQIRPGHEIYNIKLSRLILPEKWISGL